MGPGPGRPPRYCRRSHRQRLYEAERRGRARGLGADETVVSTSSWEAHRDAIYILETAVDDAAGDLAEATSLVDLHTAVEDLVRAAREVLSSAPEPHAIT